MQRQAKAAHLQRFLPTLLQWIWPVQQAVQRALQGHEELLVDACRCAWGFLDLCMPQTGCTSRKCCVTAPSRCVVLAPLALCRTLGSCKTGTGAVSRFWVPYLQLKVIAEWLAVGLSFVACCAGLWRPQHRCTGRTVSRQLHRAAACLLPLWTLWGSSRAASFRQAALAALARLPGRVPP